MFAAFAVLGLVFGFQVENCINTIIYCLIYCFFLWMVSLGLNQSPDMVKYTVLLNNLIYINQFILPKKDDTRWIKENNEFHCFTM